MDSNEISGVVYEPSSELREWLVAFSEEMSMTITQKKEFEIEPGSPTQINYDVAHPAGDIEVVQTVSDIGVLASVTGEVGLSSTFILSRAMKYGTPTLLYTDDIEFEDIGQYRDITAEWYPPKMQTEAVIEGRLEMNEGRDEIEIGKVEQLATQVGDRSGD